MTPTVTQEYLHYLEQKFSYYIGFGKWQHDQKYKQRTVPDYVDLHCLNLSTIREQLRLEIFFLRNALND